MDKEREQTPAGGIELGETPTKEKLLFVHLEQRAAWGEPFNRSQSSHNKTSLGLTIHEEGRVGVSLVLWLRGGDDVTAIMKQRGACAKPAGRFWRELFKI